MLCVKLNEITRTPVEGVLKFIPTCVQGKEHCVGLDTLILLILKHTRALLGVGGIQYFVFLLQVFFFSQILFYVPASKITNASRSVCQVLSVH